MIELNAAGTFGALGHRGRNHLYRSIQQLEDAFAGGHGRLQDVIFFAEVHDWAKESQSVLDEGDQHSQRRHRRHQTKCDQRFPIELHRDAVRGNATHHVAAAEPNYACNRDGGKNLDCRVVDRVSHDRIFERFHVDAIDFREPVVGLAFAIEEL